MLPILQECQFIILNYLNYEIVLKIARDGYCIYVIPVLRVKQQRKTFKVSLGAQQIQASLAVLVRIVLL